jgi:tRNA A22 N-methylase
LTGRVENQAKRIKIVEGSTTAAAAPPRVYHRRKNTQNHWSFSDKKFLAFLSRYWTEFRKLKILGMGGEVITGIIEKHNKIEARNFLQIDEK